MVLHLVIKKTFQVTLQMSPAKKETFKKWTPPKPTAPRSEIAEPWDLASAAKSWKGTTDRVVVAVAGDAEGGGVDLAGVSGFNFFAMEQGGGDMGSRRNLKRKFQEYEAPIFGLDELNQDLLERVLFWLPVASFFRLSSVCKQWKSVANSATFRLACSDVPSREQAVEVRG
nr:F-box only protein 13-like [Ipomoea batatas]